MGIRIRDRDRFAPWADAIVMVTLLQLVAHADDVRARCVIEENAALIVISRDFGQCIGNLLAVENQSREAKGRPLALVAGALLMIEILVGFYARDQAGDELVATAHSLL